MRNLEKMAQEIRGVGVAVGGVELIRIHVAQEGLYDRFILGKKYAICRSFTPSRFYGLIRRYNYSKM